VTLTRCGVFVHLKRAPGRSSGGFLAVAASGSPDPFAARTIKVGTVTARISPRKSPREMAGIQSMTPLARRA